MQVNWGWGKVGWGGGEAVIGLIIFIITSPQPPLRSCHQNIKTTQTDKSILYNDQRLTDETRGALDFLLIETAFLCRGSANSCLKKKLHWVY